MMKKEKEEERMLREENACNALHDACVSAFTVPFHCIRVSHDALRGRF